MPCVTIMVIIKLIKLFNHGDIYICLIYTLIYTFHLALSSPIKIFISYITSSHRVELKLEIKLIYSLHLNRLLNFLRYDRRASCSYCSKLVNSQSSGWKQHRVAMGCHGYVVRMSDSKPGLHPLMTVFTWTTVAPPEAFIFQLLIENYNSDTCSDFVVIGQ